jgi:hypothetical protein
MATTLESDSDNIGALPNAGNPKTRGEQSTSQRRSERVPSPSVIDARQRTAVLRAPQSRVRTGPERTSVTVDQSGCLGRGDAPLFSAIRKGIATWLPFFLAMALSITRAGTIPAVEYKTRSVDGVKSTC